jgi:predicted secreted protein
MTDAISSFGTLLKMGNGAVSETFTTVGEVLDIDGPDLSLDTEDVTSHDSANGWSEHIGTILNGGEVSFSLNFVPTDPTHDASTGLQADMIARTLRHFQIVLPDAGTTTYAFSALVTGFKATEPVKGKLGADVKLKISGSVSLS